jgi:DNA-binding PadR family transcriptional regulator
VSRVFAHGALRLYLLKLLADEPRHGYELIRLMEDNFLGMYTPSAGTVYPRLAALEDDGLVEHDDIDGRKVYRLTDAGRAEVEARGSELDELQARAVESARQLARHVRDEVRATVRDLRQELRGAMQDVKREERRASRDRREDRRVHEHERAEERQSRQRERRDQGRGRTRSRVEEREDARLVLRSLRADLDAFVNDVVAAARRHDLDTARVRRVRDALLGARESVIAALAGPPDDDAGQP